VEAFNALNREGSDIHFHQLHSKCHSRIHYEKVCPIHGKIPKEEIVSGYEYEKGKYVEVESEQLDALRTREERTLKIDAFIEPAAIDPLYFDGRMYYLIPANKSAEEAYSVVTMAMERAGRYAIGQVVLSGKDQLAVVRSVENVLHMAMLNFASEITSPREMFSVSKQPAGLSRQLKLAQTLIQDWSDSDFDFSKYKDTYRQKLEKLIASKIKGKKIVIPKESEPEPATISLMDALKKSIERSQAPRKSADVKARKQTTG
jgi:DNA end-binding protein Ku